MNTNINALVDIKNEYTKQLAEAGAKTEFK